MSSIDTSRIIQPFLVFDYNISPGSIASLAPKYNFIWGASTSNVAAWRAANPRMDTSFYFPCSRDGGTFSDSTPQSLAWWQANHPDWIVYRADGVTPAYFGTDPNVPLDISNPAVITWQTGQYVTPAVANGHYTYLAADNLNLINYPLAYGIYPNATPGNPFTGPFTQKYRGTASAVDSAYVTDFQNWCISFAAVCHGAGIKLMVNLSTGSDITVLVPYTDPSAVAILGAVDGILDEGGFTNFGKANNALSNLNAHLLFIASAQAQGKAYHLINILPDTLKSSVQYGLAAYLEAKGLNSDIFLTPQKAPGSPVYGQEVWFDEYSTPLGIPAQTTFNSVTGIGYFRQYAQAAVILTEATQTQAWTLPPGNYIDLLGASYQDATTLSKNQGLVLSPDETIALVAQHLLGNTNNFGTWRVGETLPIWNIAVMQTPLRPENLFGIASSACSIVLGNNGVAMTGTGTLRVANSYPGRVLYQPSAGDVVSPTTYQATLWITLPTGIGEYDLGHWQITAR